MSQDALVCLSRVSHGVPHRTLSRAANRFGLVGFDLNAATEIPPSNISNLLPCGVSVELQHSC